MAEHRPQLRQVEAFPVQTGNQRMVCLRDPFHFTDNVVSVSLSAVAILQRLDGKHALADIQAEFHRLTGQELSLPQLEAFLDKLDHALLLDSPRFRAHKAQLIRSFHEAPVRSACFAGTAYPTDPAEIGRMLDAHHEPPRGPGKGRRRPKQPPRAIVSPHIDLRRGGPGFAWAYHQLAEMPRVDTFVILGVAHSPTTHRFVGTKKHFATPLGTAKTGQAWMDSLAGKLPFDLFEDELVHRSEHSIEFQVLCLQHALGNRYEFEIEPILVGSFHDMVAKGSPPARNREVAAFVRALRDTMTESGKTVCVIAGVDLAHVGGRFGDDFTVNQDVLAQLEADDREMLKTLEQCDAAGFFDLINQDQDRRRVCGFPTLYTMLAAVPLQRGELLFYDQAFEKETNSVVSFASMRFS